MFVFTGNYWCVFNSVLSVSLSECGRESFFLLINDDGSGWFAGMQLYDLIYVLLHVYRTCIPKISFFVLPAAGSQCDSYEVLEDVVGQELFFFFFFFCVIESVVFIR